MLGQWGELVHLTTSNQAAATSTKLPGKNFLPGLGAPRYKGPVAPNNHLDGPLLPRNACFLPASRVREAWLGLIRPGPAWAQHGPKTGTSGVQCPRLWTGYT